MTPGLDDIRLLMRELFGGTYDPPLDGARLAAVLGQPNYKLFTAERDNKTVAMASLYMITLPSRRLGVIEEVVTLSPFRNQGLGSSLVNKALQEARRRKMDCVELTVREDRPEVQQFYEGLGFRDRHQRAMRLCIAR